MKRWQQWLTVLAVCVLAAEWNASVFAQLLGFAASQRTVLTIHSDGSCQLANEAVQSRATLAQEIRSVERFRQISAGGSGGPSGTNASGSAKSKPFTDQELAKKVRDLFAEASSDQDTEGPAPQVRVKVQKDTVRIDTTRSFPSVKSLLEEGASIWVQSGIPFSNARFETDTNGLLRLTLTPQRGYGHYLKLLRAQWKLTGMKSELKLIFPGKVVSSGFPETATNATWFAIDGTNDASVNAAMKLYEKPVVITAEAGGLKLNEPLESSQLHRSTMLGADIAADLPITAAGTGFVVEPLTVTATTLHVFPQGTNFFENNPFGSFQRSGLVVRAKLFAPRGRTLQSVSGVRVLKATDDKGRTVKPAEETDNSYASFTSFGDAQQSSAMQIQLRLQLPKPDAQAISNLDGEAIAVTAGKWKEMTLTNLDPNATNELDLSKVLPGAKLTVIKFDTKKNQVTIQARITGPKTIRHLEIRAKRPGDDNFNANTSERGFHVLQSKATRTVWIHGYDLNSGGLAARPPLVLVVRYPVDLKRERVRFSLKSLDLF